MTDYDTSDRMAEIAYRVRENHTPGITEKIINGALAFGFNPNQALLNHDNKLAAELYAGLAAAVAKDVEEGYYSE